MAFTQESPSLSVTEIMSIIVPLTMEEFLLRDSKPLLKGMSKLPLSSTPITTKSLPSTQLKDRPTSMMPSSQQPPDSSTT